MELGMKKVLALIAHDSKKDDIIQLTKAHKEELTERPEALNGQHLAAQYLEEMADRHE
jgi:methylglyoxal synthase